MRRLLGWIGSAAVGGILAMALTLASSGEPATSDFVAEPSGLISGEIRSGAEATPLPTTEPAGRRTYRAPVSGSQPAPPAPPPSLDNFPEGSAYSTAREAMEDAQKNQNQPPQP